MAPTRVRLASGRFFGWSSLALVVAGEAFLVPLAWPRLDPSLPLLDRLGILGLLSLSFVAVPAFPLACLATIVADLLVVALVRPIVRAWHAPRSDPAGSAFHLDPGETVLDWTPARRPDRWRGAVGSLILTERRVWFVPEDPVGEPWSLPLGSIRSIRAVAAPRMFAGLVRGLPDRLAIDAGPAPLALVVPDAASIGRWPRPHSTPEALA